MQVAICGTGGPIDAELAALAESLGAQLASGGYTLVCGGLGGVMEAAARGARQAGGLVVGILPTSNARDANPFCSVVIPTGLGEARNVLVVRAADVVVLMAGGAGTLAEAALAWQAGKPIIALAPSGGWAQELAGRAIDDRRSDVIGWASSVDEVIAFVKARRSD